MNVRRLGPALAAALLLASGAPIDARSPIAVGTLAPGPVDGITDVPGVRVGQVTKIEGNGPLVPGVGPVRTGATGILPNADTWENRVAAATYALNGDGEMTGAHWVDEIGYLETPIVLITDSALGPLAGLADARFEVVESDFGAFRSLAATFCLAMTLAVGVAERRGGG